MLDLYHKISFLNSRTITKTYSTSFSSAVNMLAPSIRPAIHSIYGFVRLADEIVDTFHHTDQEYLINKFESDYYEAKAQGISLNPILHAFQMTVNEYKIDDELIDAFLHSMKMDLRKNNYTTIEEYEKYIYGSADVVGLMCLKVFVNGNEELYNDLKPYAMKLGSAFQKVNFLRDIKNDTELLQRSYFPNVDLNQLDSDVKHDIINEIEQDFHMAYQGIRRLPKTSKFGVYTAYRYYHKLLNKLKATPSEELLHTRIRVGNHVKFGLMLQSYVNVKFNLMP